mmetsp:Transcript_72199/g.156752  ORF Transcript_72199/g.156752 Transcript_72199/m.156752 type:complete len:189 (-) Transcript_72199:24-590(-)
MFRLGRQTRTAQVVPHLGRSTAPEAHLTRRSVTAPAKFPQTAEAASGALTLAVGTRPHEEVTEVIREVIRVVMLLDAAPPRRSHKVHIGAAGDELASARPEVPQAELLALLCQRRGGCPSAGVAASQRPALHWRRRRLRAPLPCSDWLQGSAVRLRAGGPHPPSRTVPARRLLEAVPGACRSLSPRRQ